MILLQRKNYFLRTADTEDDDASDLTGDSGSDEVVSGVTQGDPVLRRNGRTWYPAEVISQAGIPSEKLFLFRNYINEFVIQ